MNRCLVEQRRRHGEELNKLRKALDKIGAISTEETSRTNKSVEVSTINCHNTSGESYKTPKKSPNHLSQFSNVVHNVESDDHRSLPSHSSGVSNDCLTHYFVGRDCDGNPLHSGDIVEVLSPSKNRAPFKYKDTTFVVISPGLRIMISRTDNEAITSFRDSKYLRLKRPKDQV